MSGHDDFAFDALPGLPERPPQGELILWQGRPDPWALARDAYRIRWFAAYFALIVLWRAGSAWADGGPALAAAMGLPYLVLGLLGLATFSKSPNSVSEEGMGCSAFCCFAYYCEFRNP
jgi:hypothetical protein